jgi:NAD(P)-dependent dehydrogenase (short-subunit alcohol dehydrogenase family)
MGTFQGVVAIVTGGASGIGEGIVRRLHGEGASVVGADINRARLESLAQDLGERFTPVVADVTRSSDLQHMVSRAVSEYGRLDWAFNVAGASAFSLVVDLTDGNWSHTIDVCLKGVVFGLKYEAEQMIVQGQGGSIVNVTSIGARMPVRGRSLYNAAKAGVGMFSRTAALELAEFNIRVNTISPGQISTPLSSLAAGDLGLRATILERIPLGHLPGEPADIASAALFLASQEARYITGADLTVDGGFEQTSYPDLRPFLG